MTNSYNGWLRMEAFAYNKKPSFWSLKLYHNYYFYQHFYPLIRDTQKRVILIRFTEVERKAVARTPRRPQTSKGRPHQQQGGHKPKPKPPKKRRRKKKSRPNARPSRSVLSRYLIGPLRRIPVWLAIIGLLGVGIFLYHLAKSGNVVVAGSLTLGMMLCLGPIIFALCSLAKVAPGRVDTNSEPEFAPQKRWRGEDPDKTDDLAQASPARSVELMDPRDDSTNPMQF